MEGTAFNRPKSGCCARGAFQKPFHETPPEMAVKWQASLHPYRPLHELVVAARSRGVACEAMAAPITLAFMNHLSATADKNPPARASALGGPARRRAARRRSGIVPIERQQVSDGDLRSPGHLYQTRLNPAGTSTATTFHADTNR